MRSHDPKWTRSTLNKKSFIDAGLGLRIRKRRKVIGMTQADLASAIGVSFQQIQKYESSLSAISDLRLRQICEVLSLPPDYFTDAAASYIGKPAAEPEVTVDLDGRPEDRDQFVASPEGRRLIDSFMRIVDVQLRTRVLDFISSLASDRPD